MVGNFRIDDTIPASARIAYLGLAEKHINKSLSENYSS